MPGINLILDPNLKPPTDLEAKLLRQIILAGMPDLVGKHFHLICGASLTDAL